MSRKFRSRGRAPVGHFLLPSTAASSPSTTTPSRPRVQHTLVIQNITTENRWLVQNSFPKEGRIRLDFTPARNSSGFLAFAEYISAGAADQAYESCFFNSDFVGTSLRVRRHRDPAAKETTTAPKYDNHNKEQEEEEEREEREDREDEEIREGKRNKGREKFRHAAGNKVDVEEAFQRWCASRIASAQQEQQHGKEIVKDEEPPFSLFQNELFGCVSVSS